MDCITKYRDLTLKQKELTAGYVYKHLKKNNYTDHAPMSVWTARIKNIIILKKDNFKINIDWDFNGISTWRSIFDILLKRLHHIGIKNGQPILYYLL